MSLYSKNEFPLVSICTPTFNRRPFIPFLIKCFQHQTYPKEHMEWIIIDDGTDKISDLIKDIPQIKYFKFDKKMSLGKKRNLMHSKCSGEILIYMDDDDYYPPERVSHAVEELQKNPDALWAGSSLMYIYFKSIKQMYTFGPYGKNHATAATFALRKELLSQTRYDETAAIAEEKTFLKGWSIPGVQLDPLKTILVFSHIHNTFNKQELLDQPDSEYRNLSNVKINSFITDHNLYNFYIINIDNILKDYDFGNLKYKPDVIIQKKEIDERRRKQTEIENVKMETKQLLEGIYKKQILGYKTMIDELSSTNNSLKERNTYLESKVTELVSQLIELKKRK
jgi:glycosyltransferase involved in cell wall biosynthesis